MLTLSLYWCTLLSRSLEILEMVACCCEHISVSVVASAPLEFPLDDVQLSEIMTYWCCASVAASDAPSEDYRKTFDWFYAFWVFSADETDGRLLESKLKDPIFLIKWTISARSI